MLTTTRTLHRSRVIIPVLCAKSVAAYKHYRLQTSSGVTRYALGQASEPSEPSEPIGVTSVEYVPICVLQYKRDLG